MTTPKKGDLVIVREKRGAFKKDVLYLAEYMNGHGFNIACFERLSDQVLVLGDHSKFIIEEVIPKEKLPKLTFRTPEDEKYERIEVFRRHYPITPEDAFPSLYPLEVGDEVEIHWEGERATDLGPVVGIGGDKAVIYIGDKRAVFGHVFADINTGVIECFSGHRGKASVTSKHKPKQDMCNKKFEYKVGQKFYTLSGIKFEVVSVAGDIAYAQRTSEPMWFTRITYADGCHLCVDDNSIMFIMQDPPIVAEAKELIARLQINPGKVEALDQLNLETLVYWLKRTLK